MGIANGFESASKVSGTNYTVEVKIPLTKIVPANDEKIGFDVQINDAKDGSRQSVAAWNDTTGTGYMDTSVYGVLTLTGKPSDTVPPVTTDNAPNGWQTQAVDVTLQATDDGNGVASTFYSLDGADFTTGNTVSISSEGTHTLRYYSVDAAGNQEAVKKKIVQIDRTAPAVTTPNTGKILISDALNYPIIVTDATSGVDTVSITLDGKVSSNPIEAGALSLSIGDHTIVVTATDKAGNSVTVTCQITVYMDTANLDALFQAGNDNHLMNPELLKSLLAKVKQVKAAGSASKKAANVLNALGNEVKAQTGKGLDSDYAALVESIIRLLGGQ